MADITLISVPLLNWPNAVTSITNTPPGGPSLNTCHIVGTSPTGAWSGHANEIARWNASSAWEFQTPTTGREVYNVGTSSFYTYNGSAWAAASGSSLQGAYNGGATIALSTGTDIDVANGSDHLLQVGSTLVLKSKDQATANTAAPTVTISGGQGGAAAAAGIPGTGGVVTIQAGTKGSEAASPGATIGGVAGNHLNLYGGSGGDSSGSKAGCVILEGGQVGTGVAGGTNVPGDVRIGQDANKTHTVRIGQSSTGTPVEVKGPVWSPLITLTDGATVTVTLGKGTAFIVTIAGNRTLDFSFPNSFSNSSVDPAGIRGLVIVKQDGTGNRTLGFAAKVKTAGDVAVTAAAASYTLFEFLVEDASNVHLRKVQGLAAAGGDFVGPGSSTNNNLVAFSGTTGKQGIDSGIPAANVVQSTRTLTAGTGLSGGGDLSANRTFTVASTPALQTTGAAVDVAASAPGIAGYILKLTDATHATWQAEAAASMTIKKAGTLVGTRGSMNLIEGSNVTITATDNSGADRVDVTIASSGGGGSSARELWETPTSPNGDDEEFGSTTPPAGWEFYSHSGSVVVTPSGSLDPYSAFTTTDAARLKTHTDWRPSYATIQVGTGGSSRNYSYTKQVTVPTNRMLWARLAWSNRYTETSATACNFGIMFAAVSSSHASLNDNVVFYMDGITSSTQGLKAAKTVASVFSVITTGPNLCGGVGMPWDYLGIHKVGTTYHFWTFADGGTKHYWGSTTHAATMACIGFFLRDGNSASPGNAIFGADFVRCIDSATQLPC